MTAISRAGWILCAALFGTLTANVFHLDHTGWLPRLLIVAFAALAAFSPRRALLALLVLVPVAWYLASQLWNSTVSWAEALTCAALTGFALDALRPGTRTPAAIGAPALLFGALTAAGIVAGVGVLKIKFGPSFTPLLTSQLTREFFTDVRTSPALHAGMLLLEGTLLAVHAARLGAERPIAIPAAAATAIGATISAGATLLYLVRAAWQQPFFISGLFDIVRTTRLNVTFADENAAGSYYAMALLMAVSLALSQRWRALWATWVVFIAAGLWLTSSRTALLAVPAAAGLAWLAQRLLTQRHAIVRSVAIAVAACVILAGVAVMLPKRGIQKGVGISTKVRIGMLQAGLRMIKSHPVFGIGLGEFQPRSTQYSSPELLASFPAVAAHGENAHNNFLQVTAEAGVAGGILFTWLIAAALFAAATPAVATNDRTLLICTAGVVAFVLTCLGGHPLLIPEPGYIFWVWIGLLGSYSKEGSGFRGRAIVAAALIAIVATTPWRTRALANEADFEHLGINVSPLWQMSPDGIRYRDAKGHATLFVPKTSFTLSVNLRSDRPQRLEMRLDGRVADIKSVSPGVWTDIKILGRTEHSTARFAQFDLRVIDGDEIVMWITKVQEVR